MVTRRLLGATLPKTPHLARKGGRIMDLKRWYLLSSDPDDDQGGGEGNPHGGGSGDGVPDIGDDQD